MKQQEQPIHNEKLLKAKAEIEAILLRHDIACVAVLHVQDGPQGYLENIVHLKTDYSVVYMDGPKLKALKPPLASASGDTVTELAFKAKVAGTVNMLANLSHKLGQLRGATTGAEMMVRQNFNLPPPGGQNGAIVKPLKT
jgi:hypothetical protein